MMLSRFLIILLSSCMCCSSFSATPVLEDNLVRAAVGAAAAGQTNDLASIVNNRRAKELQKGDKSPLRLSDAMLYLFNCSLPDREQFLQGQELAATETQSDQLRTRILLSLLDDEYYEMNQLKGQDKFNKFTRVFNRASSSLSKLALFQPQDAAQLLLDSVYSARKAKTPSERERRILYLARIFLNRYPQAPEKPEVLELQTQLRTKLDGDASARYKLLADTYSQQRNWWCAEFNIENAVVLKRDDEKLRLSMEELSKTREDDENAMAASLGVSQYESRLSKPNLSALERGARALVNGDGKALKAAGESSDQISDSVQYALASLYEKTGDHDNALRQLDSIARNSPQSPGGMAAAVALRNPNYNLDEMFEESARKVAEERKQLILTGKRSTEETLYTGGSAALQAGSQAATGVPFLFATDIMVRGVADRFRTQVSTDRILDAGARYLRRYPESQRRKVIAQRVAEISKVAGQYEDAEQYFAVSGGGTEKEKAKIRENKAREAFDKAMKADNLLERKKLLEVASGEYPDCKIIKSITKELSALHPTIEQGSIILTYDMLKNDTGLSKDLGLPTQWLDGEKSNGELSKEGIAFDGSIRRYAYKLRGETEFHEVGITEPQQQSILTRSRELRGTSQVQIAGQQMLDRQKFPFAVEGGAGGSGVELAPKIIPIPETRKNPEYFKD